METKGKRLIRRGIFSLLNRRNAQQQCPNLSDLLNGPNSQQLLDSADALLQGFIVNRLLTRAAGKCGSNQSNIVLEKTSYGYTFTLGTYTRPMASDVTINEEIVTVALGLASEHGLISSGDSNKATFIMPI